MNKLAFKCHVRTAAPKSALSKALTYLKEQWPYLCNYLKDGRLEISNNRAERSIKPFVIDRKNFLFANTPGRAKSSAVIFSLIETTKESGFAHCIISAFIYRKRMGDGRRRRPGQVSFEAKARKIVSYGQYPVRKTEDHRNGPPASRHG